MSRRFVHLHVHSEYSLADSTIRIPDLVARCAAHGQPSVAITDRNNLFALVKFYRAAEAAGLKPIAGADIQVADGDELAWPLTLLCRDRDGYLALSRLLTRAWMEGHRHDGVVVRPEWLRDGNRWVLDAIGVQGDGAETASVNILGREMASQAERCMAMRIRKTPEELALARRAYGYFDQIHAYARDLLLEYGTDLTDFQLATRFSRRTVMFRLAAYEDLRHMLKQRSRF
jgi:DNA polymerase III alpha subunit